MHIVLLFLHDQDPGNPEADAENHRVQPYHAKKAGHIPPHRREIRGHEKPPPHGYICQSLQNARRFGSRNSDGRKIDPSRAEFPCRTGICFNKIFISLQKTFARGRAATTVSVQRILRDKSPRPPPHRSSLVQRTATQAAPTMAPLCKGSCHAKHD